DLRNDQTFNEMKQLSSLSFVFSSLPLSKKSLLGWGIIHLSLGIALWVKGQWTNNGLGIQGITSHLFHVLVHSRKFDWLDELMSILESILMFYIAVPVASALGKILLQTTPSAASKSLDDCLRTLKLSNKVRAWIAKRLRDGLSIKGVAQIFRKKSREIDTLWNNQVVLEEQIKHKVEKQGVELWRLKIEKTGDLTCIIPQQNNDKVMEGDARRQCRLADIRAGRMLPSEKETRQRQLKGERLMNSVLRDSINQNYWTVNSETTQGQPQFGIDELLVITEQSQSHTTKQPQYSITELQQFNTIEQVQTQPTTEEIISKIQSLTRTLNDLDINRLQVVYDQLSRALRDVRKQERNFKDGDWISENQRVVFPPHMNYEKQRATPIFSDNTSNTRLILTSLVMPNEVRHLDMSNE
ncbi:22364_t:CDS:2, partial [Gigaspora margarita]